MACFGSDMNTSRRECSAPRGGNLPRPGHWMLPRPRASVPGVRPPHARRERSWTLLWLVLVCLVACSRAPRYEGALTFKRDGKLVKSIPLQELMQLEGAGEIETADPY